MRILIQSPNFRPELTGIGKIVAELADWLAACGHEVSVVAAPPHYPEWRIHPGYSAFRYRCEHWNGGRCRTWRCPIWVPRRPSGLTRLLFLASFALSSFPVMLAHIAWRPHVVMLTEPPLFCAPGAVLAARLAGAVSWLNVQDFEVDAAFALGLLPWAPLRAAARYAESWLIRRFDRVSSISPAMAARTVAKGVPTERVLLFRDWVDLEVIKEEPEAASKLRVEWGLPAHEIVVLYSGNLGVKQGLDLLIDAARALLPRREIRFVVCGDGAARQQLAAAAASLPNFHLRGLVPAGQFNTLLHLADVHLLPQRVQASELVMPSKLLYMLASARPIIATAAPDTEVGAAVLAAGGILTPPGRAPELAAAIVALADDPQRRLAAGARGRALAEATFAKPAVLGAFHEQLAGLVASAGWPQ